MLLARLSIVLVVDDLDHVLEVVGDVLQEVDHIDTPLGEEYQFVVIPLLLLPYCFTALKR